MLKIDKSNGVYIARFEDTDRLNTLNADHVKNELNVYFSVPDTLMVIDLGGIAFIDSTGFGIFLSLMKAAFKNQGQFKIANISEEVMELFKLLQLHHVFEIHKTVEDAINSFS